MQMDSLKSIYDVRFKPGDKMQIFILARIHTPARNSDKVGAAVCACYNNSNMQRTKHMQAFLSCENPVVCDLR